MQKRNFIISLILFSVLNGAVYAQSGKQIYQSTCAACHGGNGKGSVPGTPDFTDPNGVLKNSDSVLLSRVVNGFESHGSPMAMPPKGGNPSLTSQELESTIRYIRKRFGGQKTSSLRQSHVTSKNTTNKTKMTTSSIKAEMIAHGAKSWANTCSGCHNLRDPKSFSAAQWSTITQHMRVQAHLSGQKTKEILAFLQSASN